MRWLPTSHRRSRQRRLHCEAVKALPAQVVARCPDVPWSNISRMRDLIAHHYYKLDAEIVRATIDAPLASLRDACEVILAEGQDDSPT